jgi:hypothetical protein
MEKLLLVAGLGCCLALASPLRAQEAQGGLLAPVFSADSNPAISLILDTVAAYHGAQDRLATGGHSPASSGFAVTGAELAMSSNVDPYFKLDLALCFTHMHLEEVYFTTLALPGNLQARGGLFLSRVGRHNNTHPHSWDFVVHPLANQFIFGSEGLGAPGFELSWLAPLPWYLEVIVASQMGEGGAFRTKPRTFGDPGWKDLLYPARLVNFLELSDDWSLQLGANAVLGPSVIGPEVGNRSYAYGSDLLLKWRPLGGKLPDSLAVTLLVESWLREMEAPGQIWRDAGGYGDLAVDLSRRWRTALRAELWRQLSGGQGTATVPREAFGVDARRLAASLTFAPTHFSRIRLQWGLEEVEGFALNQQAFLQFELSAGAHGAHGY